MNQVEADPEGNGIPPRFAFIAPALFGVSLFVAGLLTLSAGLPEDIAHAVSSLAVLATMAWLYRSFGLGFNRLRVVAVLSAVSAGVLLQAVSIGTIAIVSKIDTAATVAITFPICYGFALSIRLRRNCAFAASRWRPWSGAACRSGLRTSSRLCCSPAFISISCNRYMPLSAPWSWVDFANAMESLQASSRIASAICPAFFSVWSSSVLPSKWL